MEKISFEIGGGAGVKLDTFALQHSLLFVCWQYDAAGRAAALRIDHALPRRLSFIGAVHHKANGARRITFAENVSKLAIGHHPATRNATHQRVNPLTIIRAV